MKTNYFILFFALLLSYTVHATHNRSGSITYEHISGNTYKFTVKTCTKTSVDADRDELEIKWGDGTMDTIPRDNIVFLNYDVQVNTYIGTHDFGGPGTYIISVEDPNRNQSIVNIFSSVNVSFCVQSELIISPFIGSPNNSIVIQDCPCPEFACTNETYCYNISAFDPDGDSLSYSIVPCRGSDCLELSIPQVYNYPDVAGGGSLSIDPVSGTLCWENPTFEGEYNVAIKISEYRNGFYIGSVLQDMQITVQSCLNKSPQIREKADTCVLVGDNVNMKFTATDIGDNIDLYATGELFSGTNPAVFNPASGNDSVTATFTWTPNCSQAKLNDYIFIVHANDNDPAIQLTDLLTYKIKVNLPPVTNLTVAAQGGNMNLNWDVYDPSLNCSDFTYQIYRSTDSVASNSECCDNDLIGAMGYSLIGTSTINSFTDVGPLSVGNKYCYLVTVKLASGKESCISSQVCEELDFVIPVMTNVTVVETDNSLGSDSIIWSWPKELDTVVFSGPYHYELYRNNGFDFNTNTLVYSSPTNANIAIIDSFFFDQNLNTADQAYNYAVSLYSDGTLVGTSTAASSILVTSDPNDNQLTLNWTENVPWINNYYKIYRESPTGSGNFIFLDSTEATTYVDTGLVNLNQYCYKIQSVGGYFQSGIASPLINWSQEHCNEPFDFTPPCPPTAYISGNCDLEETYINWTNPNNSCADDVVKYRLYYAKFEGDSLEFLAEIASDLDTFYVHKDRGSIAGCYYVTAVDSMPYNNESLPSNTVCIDNCDGYYVLPNVFTPNGNSINDLYHPILPYKFVESIEMNIFNRYGDLVHSTTNPMINWDGTYLNTGKSVSDGVYFYNCKVNVLKLSGIQTIDLSGTITILNSK